MISPEQLFRALSDTTRMHCLLLLLAEEHVCVCEFVHALELSQPRISRHLGHLRDMGIVLDERRGQWVHYRLHPNLPQWALQILEQTLQAKTIGDVRGRLAGMPNRPGVSCD